MTEEQRIKSFSHKFKEKIGFNNTVLNKYRIKKILEHCSGKQTLLELGCGYGRITKSLAPYFSKITAVDGSQDLINMAKQENSSANISYISSLIETLELDEKFDLVLLCCVLEHVLDPQQVLKKSASFLKDNGSLLIIVPNCRSLHRRIGKQLGIIKELNELNASDREYGHRRVYSLEELSKDIKQAGLNIDKKHSFFIKPLSNNQMEQIDPKICDALYEVSKDIDNLGSMLFVSASTPLEITRQNNKKQNAAISNGVKKT